MCKKAVDLAKSMIGGREPVQTVHGKTYPITAKQAKYLGNLLGQAGLQMEWSRGMGRYPWVDTPDLSFRLFIRKHGSGLLIQG